MHQFLKFIFGIKLYMFRTVPLSIISSFSLYTQQWYMSYRFAYSLRARSGWNQLASGIRMEPACEQDQDGTGSVLFIVHTAMVYVSKLVWHIPLLCVQWKTPDDGQRNCPKRVEFYSRNKFEKLVHLVGFVIRILGLWPLACWDCGSESRRWHRCLSVVM